MQINVFSRQDLNRPIESISRDFSGTLSDFFRAEVRGFTPEKLACLSVYADGRKTDWSARLDGVKKLDVIIEPGGIETAYAIVAVIVAVTSVAYSLYMMSRLKTDTQAKTSDTSTIYDVNAQGNKVKLQQVVPENFGYIKHYPDYLADKHTFYRRNKKYIDMILCQGVGYYEHKTDGSDIYIGNTPFNGYPSSDVKWQIFDPGEDISENGIESGMHKCWYSSPEVTSSGKTLDPVGNVDPGTSSGYTEYTAGKGTANYKDGGLRWHVSPKSIYGDYWSYAGYAPSVTTGGGQRFYLAAANLSVKVGDYIQISNASNVRKWADNAECEAAKLDSGNIQLTWTADGTYSDLSYIADTAVNVTITRSETYMIQVGGGNAGSKYKTWTATTGETSCNVISYSQADGKITVEISGIADLPDIPESDFNGYGTLIPEKLVYYLTITQALSSSIIDPLTGAARVSDDGTYEITEIGSVTSSRAASGAGGANTEYLSTKTSAPVYTLKRIDPDTDTEIPWSGFWGTGWVDGVADDAFSVAVQTNPDAEGAKEYAGPYRACPIGAICTQFEVDIDFPAGLGYLNSSGKYDERTVKLSIEWRNINEGGTTGSGKWEAYNYEKTAATGDELAETITFDLPAGAYECRIKNLSDKVDDAAQVDTVKWTGLKSCIATPKKYDGMTVILCRFRGSETLSELSENQIATFWTRKLAPVGGGDLAATEDIAPAVQYILQNSKYANIIDMDSLRALDAYCKNHHYVLSGTIDDDSTLLDSLRNVLKTCMAEVTVTDNKVAFAWMEKKTDGDPYQQLFMPQNVTAAPSVNLTFAKDDDVKEIELSYIDSVTWKTSTWFYHLDEKGNVVETTYATTKNAEKLDTWGVKGTNAHHEQARALAERRLKFLTYSKIQYEVQTELDALNCQYLDYVGLVLPQELSNITGRITAYDSAAKTITVDQPIPSSISSGVICVRKKDGSSISYTFTRADTYTLVLGSALFDWDENYGATIEYPYFAIGSVVPCWVQSVEPGDKTCNLNLVNYDERVF